MFRIKDREVLLVAVLQELKNRCMCLGVGVGSGRGGPETDPGDTDNLRALPAVSMNPQSQSLSEASVGHRLSGYPPQRCDSERVHQWTDWLEGKQPEVH